MSNVEKRIDQNKIYACIMVGLFVLTGTMVLVGVPPSVLTDMHIRPVTQLVLSSLLFIGASMSLTGLCLGTRFFRPNADIRLCYRYGIWGNELLAVTIWVYTFKIFTAALPNVIYAVGQGFWPLLLGLGFALTGRDLLRDIRSTERKMHYVIKTQGS